MRLLDLFCGAGGAAMGYHQAGFTEIVGVDIAPQPNYPFEFVQADALEFLENELVFSRPSRRFRNFDLIHASPPCQAYSRAWTLHKKEHPRLVGPTRRLLKASPLPWVMENVVGSGLLSQASLFGGHGVTLCATAFELRVEVRGQLFELQRHRLFESSFPIPPLGCNHVLPVIGVYGHGSMSHERRKAGDFNVSSADVRREVMEMPWANRDEIGEAIPPAYTKYIGEQFLNQMEVV